MRLSILHAAHSAVALLLPMAPFAPFASLTMATALLGGSAVQAEQELAITKPTMKIFLEAAKLSQLAYEPDLAQYAVGVVDGEAVGEDGEQKFEHPDYEEIYFYTNEPDQAIVAKSKDGLCYLAFRGTNANADDWAQNLNTNDANIYKDADTTSSEFCEVREGFADFLQTPEVVEGIIKGTADLFDCIESCTDKANCLVITGHSQGGATANVAAIMLYSSQPTVVTFGQPPAVDANCSLIPSDRYYRFVNSRTETGETDDVGFDPVPGAILLSEFVSHSVHYGHFLMLGDDTGGVKYMGYDEEDFTDFNPDLVDADIQTHKMPPAPETTEQYPSSYLAHIQGLYDNMPDDVGSTLRTTGFTDGTVCERSYDMLCDSGLCVNNLCQGAPYAEICVKGTCEEDGDCVSGACIMNSCAAGEGQVDIECPCEGDGDCLSGYCDIKFTSFDWVCAVDPDTDPDANPDANPDAKPDAKPDANPDTDPDVNPDANPDANPDTDPDANPDDPGPNADTARDPGNAEEVTTSGDSSIGTKQTSSAAAAFGLVFFGYFFM